MMNAYEMYRFTIVAPSVTNAGAASGYPAALRAELQAYGILGWTEYETAGYWRGKREAGVTFELFLTEGGAAADGTPWRLAMAARLGELARGVMPDQEAIQVTVDPAPITLVEG